MTPADNCAGETEKEHNSVIFRLSGKHPDVHTEQCKEKGGVTVLQDEMD